jgi:glycosyltransferase involved in cell wall biosynthesis
MEKGKKIPILIIGDAVVTTGFARVLHSIFSVLTDKYDIHHLGVNYKGDPHDFNYKIYPALIAVPGADLYGISRLQSMIETIKPKLIFILNDIWVHSMYMERLEKLLDKTKVVLYFPVDAGPIEGKWLTPCLKASRLLVYTKFGESVVQDALNQLLKKEPETVVPKIEIIPHGIDTTRFYPYSDVLDADGKIILSGKTLAKKRLYTNQSDDFINSFIILNSNRNQPRKRIDTTIKAFSMFAKDKPENVKLYLHMGIEDAGWNIVDLAIRHKIDSRFIVSSMTKNIPGVNDERMNLIYNACDVGLNTSVGEGWGLTNWEHAATRAAQIVPNHSACKELWVDKAMLIEPKLYLTNERVMTEGGIVSPDDVANAMQILYDNKNLREELAQKSYEYVTSKEFSWDTVSETVDRIIQEVINE